MATLQLIVEVSLDEASVLVGRKQTTYLDFDFVRSNCTLLQHVQQLAWDLLPDSKEIGAVYVDDEGCVHPLTDQRSSVALLKCASPENADGIRSLKIFVSTVRPPRAQVEAKPVIVTAQQQGDPRKTALATLWEAEAQLRSEKEQFEFGPLCGCWADWQVERHEEAVKTLRKRINAAKDDLFKLYIAEQRSRKPVVVTAQQHGDTLETAKATLREAEAQLSEEELRFELGPLCGEWCDLDVKGHEKAVETLNKRIEEAKKNVEELETSRRRGSM